MQLNDSIEEKNHFFTQAGSREKNQLLPLFVSRKPKSPTLRLTYMWLQSTMNFYILATVRVKVVALSIETLRWRTLGVCY